jgi:hypothetical protein
MKTKQSKEIKLLTTLVALSFLAFGCLVFPQRTQAGSPPPDGGYPGGNTAEGTNALLSLTTGTYNTAVGFLSLESNTEGQFNTALGAGALFANVGDPSSGAGVENTATGAGALLSNTTGGGNTANGAFALFSNSTGAFNTATGDDALLNNTTGDNNTATGDDALLNNTTGVDNTAIGVGTLSNNVNGFNNTAIGVSALFSNTTGVDNTAIGLGALVSNTTSGNNTAIGFDALVGNTTGDDNTAIGLEALGFNIDGNDNTAIGVGALIMNQHGLGNTALGARTLDNNTGSFNVAINGGHNLTGGIFNIDIANDGVADESNTTRIGILQNRCFISGIRDVTTGVPDAINVVIDSAGQLGTVSSSRRFKDEIKPMDQASEAILRLKPVTFHYKSDHTARPQFGLIAEEVAEVNPDLVVRDNTGEIYTVRYDQVNAMLLNEFLKEHRKNEQQEATIARLEKQIEALNVGLQKVSAQFEGSKPAPQLVDNP